ncbi:MAG TPA: choice-of-anchor X domain-containing protein [Phycisphaerales bacterium]|nr:choice-of-anchor X domain-containing protein [Phycisphaerales bacterium]
MDQSTRYLGLCVAATLTTLAGQAMGQTCGAPSQGPDVIVGDLPNTSNYTPVGGIDAFSMATTSCNLGNQNLLWNAFPANTHPAITQNMYRYKVVNGTGRFEQIGQSWLKHGFTALTGNVCCTCNNPGSGSLLGVGCSDPYTAERNASQNGLGPKYQVNASTGWFPTGGPATGTGGSGSVYRRLQFALSEVTNSAGGTAAAERYFGESQYVSQDDAAAGNKNNNASYRELAITGTATDRSVAFSTATGAVANTSRMNPAIRAWAVCEPGVTLTNVDVANDGRFIVGSKAYDLGGGMWRYEYAIFNLNSHRSGGSFSIPVPDAATVTNIGFTCPKYHSGDGDGNQNFSDAPWTTTRANDALTFACETEAQNIRANALRWSTLYNFRFDTNVPPAGVGNVKMGLWRSGSPSQFLASAQSPGSFPAPLDGGGTATPSTVQITGSTLLTVNVIPATNPTSTGVTVVGNLTNINGSAEQAFYDDGTHGDVTAGDNVFSFLATLPEPLTAGARSVTFTASDAQSRIATGSINFNLTAAPSGGCCIAGNCSIQSAYQCTQAGGTYRGDASNCGAATYTITSTGSGFATIVGQAGTTAAATVSGCDECSQQVGLPFSFPFYGTNYGSVHIHSNGYLQFGTTANVSYQNGAIPNANVPNNAIYVAWNDYDLADQGDCYYRTDGVAPNRRFTVEWNNVTEWNITPNNSSTFQAVLHEGTGHVEFRYGTVAAAAISGATVGIENANGTVAVSVAGSTIGTGNTTRTVNNVPAQNPCPATCGTADYNGDGDTGTDQDIEAFFACIGGTCCQTCWHLGSDFNADGDAGTDQDIEAFFRVLGGGNC